MRGCPFVLKLNQKSFLEHNITANVEKENKKHEKNKKKDGINIDSWSDAF